MPLKPEMLANLAQQQAALVTALLDSGEPPPGFNAANLRTAAAALARKRARSTMRAWPGLTLALGDRFNESFAAYAKLELLPQEGGPLADGRAFAKWLSARNELPAEARIQAFEVDLRYRATPEGLIPRRWPAFRITKMPNPKRLILAIWIPWRGA
ncbi:hypothetical protein BH10PLA2_BH10PLA2_39170 [soil metagenome]